eukprot:3975053-Pleurochrysis_carterae.AAC.5
MGIGTARCHGLSDVVIHVGRIRGGLTGSPTAVAGLGAPALLSVGGVRATERRQVGELGSDAGCSEECGVLLRLRFKSALGKRDAGAPVSSAHGDDIRYGPDVSVSSVEEEWRP